MDDATAEALMQNTITGYIHCARCLLECPSYMSAAEFARLAVGYTPSGLQVWCVRHNMNVYHLVLVDEARPVAVTCGVDTEAPYTPAHRRPHGAARPGRVLLSSASPQKKGPLCLLLFAKVRRPTPKGLAPCSPGTPGFAICV